MIVAVIFLLTIAQSTRADFDPCAIECIAKGYLGGETYLDDRCLCTVSHVSMFEPVVIKQRFRNTTDPHGRCICNKLCVDKASTPYRRCVNACGEQCGRHKRCPQICIKKCAIFTRQVDNECDHVNVTECRQSAVCFRKCYKKIAGECVPHKSRRCNCYSASDVKPAGDTQQFVTKTWLSGLLDGEVTPSDSCEMACLAKGATGSDITETREKDECTCNEEDQEFSPTTLVQQFPQNYKHRHDGTKQCICSELCESRVKVVPLQHDCYWNCAGVCNRTEDNWNPRRMAKCMDGCLDCYQNLTKEEYWRRCEDSSNKTILCEKHQTFEHTQDKCYKKCHTHCHGQFKLDVDELKECTLKCNSKCYRLTTKAKRECGQATEINLVTYNACFKQLVGRCMKGSGSQCKCMYPTTGTESIVVHSVWNTVEDGEYSEDDKDYENNKDDDEDDEDIIDEDDGQGEDGQDEGDEDEDDDDKDKDDGQDEDGQDEDDDDEDEDDDQRYY